MFLSRLRRRSKSAKSKKTKHPKKVKHSKKTKHSKKSKQPKVSKKSKKKSRKNKSKPKKGGAIRYPGEYYGSKSGRYGQDNHKMRSAPNRGNSVYP